MDRSFKDKGFQYYGASMKNLIFRGWGGGGVHEKQIYKTELPKKTFGRLELG